MNETYYIKLTGKANIEKPLQIGHNFAIISDGSITSEKKTDNEDGSFNVTYQFEPITCTIQKDHGEMVKAKDTRSWSAKIRARIFRHWESVQDGRTSEEAYEAFMKQVNLDLEEIYEKSKR